MRRQRIKTDLHAWCVEGLSDEGYVPDAHHELMIRELEGVADGTTERLMLCLPPGSAKSTYGSILFPPWFLQRRPNLRMIACSHTSDLAMHFGRQVRNKIYEHSTVLGVSIKSDERASDRWATSTGSAYFASGVGGPIAGRRADLVVIDDPVKNRQEAESPATQETNWKWFTGDLRTRLRPGGRIVIIMTRWSKGDLGGRLLDAQGTVDEGGLWKLVSVPAQATSERDPLGRAPGEWLWNDDPQYAYGEELQKIHAEYEESGAMRDWYSLYQQEPRSNEGALFKPEKIQVIDTVKHGGTVVRGWDFAATEQVGTRDPDWTVGLKLQRYGDGRYCIQDIVRLRGEPHQVEEAVLNTAKQDGKKVYVDMPQDPGAAGKAVVANYAKLLTGWRVRSSPETGSKVERAEPVIAQVNVGNFDMVSARWNSAFVEEAKDFPGVKKDQVDALSRAFAALLELAGPMRIGKKVLARAGITKRRAVTGLIRPSIHRVPLGAHR